MFLILYALAAGTPLAPGHLQSVDTEDVQNSRTPSLAQPTAQTLSKKEPWVQ